MNGIASDTICFPFSFLCSEKLSYKRELMCQDLNSEIILNLKGLTE